MWGQVMLEVKSLQIHQKLETRLNRMGRGLHGVAEASYFQVPLLIGWVNKLKQKKKRYNTRYQIKHGFICN